MRGLLKGKRGKSTLEFSRTNPDMKQRYTTSLPNQNETQPARSTQKRQASRKPAQSFVPSLRQYTGSISGRILPANPLALAASPPGATGVFGAQVVAVDAASGAVVGAALGGWSCIAPGPAQLDG